MNACWTGCSCPFFASPSMVTTSRPSACAASIRHDVIGRPSTIMEHAPQSPVPQPSFAPVRRSSSRTISSSVERGSTATSHRCPLTVSVTSCFVMRFNLDHYLQHFCLRRVLEYWFAIRQQTLKIQEDGLSCVSDRFLSSSAFRDAARECRNGHGETSAFQIRVKDDSVLAHGSIVPSEPGHG